MKKLKKPTLTEEMIAKAVKETLNEMDWKYWANAAKKRLKQSREDNDPQSAKDKWERFYKLQDKARNTFNDDFVGLLKYDTMGDKAHGTRSPKFNAHFNLAQSDRMPYGAVKGSNKSGDEIFSTAKDTYHSSKGLTTPGKFFKDKEVASAFKKADDELWDYHNGKYSYNKEKGWHMTEERIRSIVRESIRKTINENIDDGPYDDYYNPFPEWEKKLSIDAFFNYRTGELHILDDTNMPEPFITLKIYPNIAFLDDEEDEIGINNIKWDFFDKSDAELVKPEMIEKAIDEHVDEIYDFWDKNYSVRWA